LREEIVEIEIKNQANLIKSKTEVVAESSNSEASLFGNSNDGQQFVF
jgi:hypothetical protein